MDVLFGLWLTVSVRQEGDSVLQTYSYIFKICFLVTLLSNKHQRGMVFLDINPV
jgi:hypothetical protein